MDSILVTWWVFRVACVSLNIVTLAALQCYERTIERLVLLWPNVWSLIAQADDKARGERLEKVRRQLVADKQKGKQNPDDWAEDAPWSYCFRIVAQDERFWNEQLVSPATAEKLRVDRWFKFKRWGAREQREGQEGFRQGPGRARD